MDNKDNTVTLYTSQTKNVIDIIYREKIYFAEQKYIKEKYGEVYNVFSNAYKWYVERASIIVNKPFRAESGIWGFIDIKYIDRYEGSCILKMKVPIKEAIFFSMADWNRVLNMKYIGQNDDENNKFNAKIALNSIKDESDIIMTPYYPLLKNEVIRSWENLFRYDESFKNNVEISVHDLQAGLWYIKEEWIDEKI